MNTGQSKINGNRNGRAAPTKAEERRASERIAELSVEINKCFVENILPAVFDVENDLNQAGYWNRLDIIQSNASDSGKPDIKAVAIYFYPEKTDSFSFNPDKLDSTYQAHIAAAGNLRDMTFSIRFPKRLPPRVETDDLIVRAEKVTTQSVDAFLERFVKGAIDAYNSDRVLR